MPLRNCGFYVAVNAGSDQAYCYLTLITQQFYTVPYVYGSSYRYYIYAVLVSKRTICNQLILKWKAKSKCGFSLVAAIWYQLPQMAVFF